MFESGVLDRSRRIANNTNQMNEKNDRAMNEASAGVRECAGITGCI